MTPPDSRSFARSATSFRIAERRSWVSWPERRIFLEGIDAFVGRGGGLVGLEGGTYLINDILLHHARIGFTVKHPATLGSQLAHDFAATCGGKAFVVNPPDVDEFDLIARV